MCGAQETFIHYIRKISVLPPMDNSTDTRTWLSGTLVKSLTLIPLETARSLVIKSQFNFHVFFCY